MAAVTMRDHLPATTRAIDFSRIGLGLGNVILLIIDAIKAKQVRLQTRRTLTNLSDAMLEDIGITRAEILDLTR